VEASRDAREEQTADFLAGLLKSFFLQLILLMPVLYQLWSHSSPQSKTTGDFAALRANLVKPGVGTNRGIDIDVAGPPEKDLVPRWPSPLNA